MTVPVKKLKMKAVFQFPVCWTYPLSGSWEWWRRQAQGWRGLHWRTPDVL